MARHRFGSGYGHALGILRAREITVHRVVRGLTTLLSVDAEVINSKVVLRIQQWFLYDQGPVDQITEWPDIGICAHFPNKSQQFREILECSLRYYSAPGQCQRCYASYICCTMCELEFNMQLRDCGKDRKAFVVTKWVGLGNGIHPSDICWRRNFKEHAHLPRIDLVPVVRSDPLHRQFERQAAVTTKALSDENETLLCRRAYRRSFNRVYEYCAPKPQDIWVQLPPLERGAHKVKFSKFAHSWSTHFPRNYQDA